MPCAPSIEQKAAEALADPSEYGNLFPDMEFALQVWMRCALVFLCGLGSLIWWVDSVPSCGILLCEGGDFDYLGSRCLARLLMYSFPVLLIS